MVQNKTVLTTERKKTRPFHKKQGERNQFYLKTKSPLFVGEDNKEILLHRGSFW